ncbi:hypothetical protein BJV78DRAFT_1280695 [Lactifluus subvellereus]|nr:hypothetical protein BJV78DRAFT_1280695 [Lactifluus subvellereus]
MFANRFQILLTLAVAAAGVSAQAGLDTCILTCLQNASKASGSCADFTNLSCVCTNTVFQTGVASCLQTNCTTQDQQTALQLQQQQCGSASTGSAKTASATTPASTSKSSNGATPVGQLPFFTAAIAIVGVSLGGALVL